VLAYPMNRSSSRTKFSCAKQRWGAKVGRRPRVTARKSLLVHLSDLYEVSGGGREVESGVQGWAIIPKSNASSTATVSSQGTGKRQHY